ncbi:MAG: type II toxin-antitoxin system PemK/MazF family toxin [Candidatus Fermentibacteria bacterium]|nr:type II toxin-antitoxin system PemK/MazF family toxin [Candidatus Fermentibacteria bacterium]
MKRGEIWWVNFSPSIGGEISKSRPAIIVSNNAANQFLNRVQVIPLSSSTAKLYPSEAYISFNGVQSKAMADQLATVSKKRITNKAGQISHDEMFLVEKAISTQLDL